jgi:hypothetical protein
MANLDFNEEELNEDIQLDEGTPTEDGGMEFEIIDEQDELLGEFDNPLEVGHYENLVATLPEEDLAEIAQEVIEGYETDKQSRSDWDETVVTGLENLGLKYEELSEPFEGACAATHPVILENAIKFQAKASSELLPPGGPVKTQILGDNITEDLQKRAHRVKRVLNYQLTEVIHEYYPDTERMYLYVALIGSGFKKTWWDNNLQRPCSEYVPVDQFYVNQSAPDIRRAERWTQVLYLTDINLQDYVEAGLYMEPPEGMQPGKAQHSEITNKVNEIMGFSSPSDLLEDEVYTVLHQRKYLDLGDGYAPYLIDVDLESEQVLSIRRNWRENDTSRKDRQWFSHYTFIPGFGFYGLGLIHVLGNFQATLTTVLRSLVDAGQFANLQGGFKLRGLRVVGDDGPISFGEWRDVELYSGASLRDALMPLPYKEPSAVLFEMLQFLEGRAQKFADTTEQVIADSTNYGPVGTTMALLEASTKFYSAVHKRMHWAQKQELRILAEINYDFLPQTGYTVSLAGEFHEAFREDFDPKTIDVVPVSDPNIASQAQRVTIAQSILTAAQQAPHLHDLKAVYRRFYTAMDIDNIEELLPPDQEAQPQGPLQDIQDAVAGKPIGVFPGQDHGSHVAVKSAWLQDPSQGGSPIMQQVVPIVAANLREHQLAMWVEAVGSQLGDNAARTEFAEAQAAQRVARANQIAMEEEQEGSPAMVLAKAEELKAFADAVEQITDAEDSRVDREVKIYEQIRKFMETSIKAEETGAKLNLERVQQIIDMAEAANKENFERENAERQAQAQRQQPKTTLTKKK